MALLVGSRQNGISSVCVRPAISASLVTTLSAYYLIILLGHRREHSAAFGRTQKMIFTTKDMKSTKGFNGARLIYFVTFGADQGTHCIKFIDKISRNYTLAVQMTRRAYRKRETY